MIFPKKKSCRTIKTLLKLNAYIETSEEISYVKIKKVKILFR